MLDTQYNADLQSYHDAIAACSAQKWATSGGTINPSALTYGAGEDLTTGQVYTAPVAPLSLFVAAGQPNQGPAQIAATTAALAAAQAQPLFWNGGSSAPTPPTPAPIVTQSAAVPGSSASSQTPASSAPASATPGAAAPGSSAGQTAAPGFDFSSIPWYVWVIGGGLAIWGVSKA